MKAGGGPRSAAPLVGAAGRSRLWIYAAVSDMNGFLQKPALRDALPQNLRLKNSAFPSLARLGVGGAGAKALPASLMGPSKRASCPRVHHASIELSVEMSGTRSIWSVSPKSISSGPRFAKPGTPASPRSALSRFIQPTRNLSCPGACANRR